MIRRAERRDVEAIVRMLADDHLGKTREDISSPLNDGYVKAFEAVDQDPNQILAVTEIEDGIAGCLQISFIPGLSRKGAWRAQIESVRVAAAHRGSGLGQKMIVWAIEQAKERGCILAQLTTDKSRAHAHRFYERLGFISSHEGMKLDLVIK
jgi:ribosomal protein S18 acetylase RimI-like enzyme